MQLCCIHKDFVLICGMSDFLRFLILTIAFAMNPMRVQATFYSPKDKKEYTYQQLLSYFDLVVLTSKNCGVCQQLAFNLQTCTFPEKFKVAWVGSLLSIYKFKSNEVTLIKTSEKTIQKMTSVTPTSFLKGQFFKKGIFNCSDFE